MKLNFIALSTSLFFSSLSFAVMPGIPMHNFHPKYILDYNELIKLAQSSMAKEVKTFNDLLSIKEKDIGKEQLKKIYGSNAHTFRVGLKLFQKIEITQIDPAYIYDKCIFNQSDIANLESTVLTLDDDATYDKKNNLSDEYDRYGKKFGRVIFQICKRSYAHFEERLSRVKFTQSELSLSEKDQKIIAKTIFYPTVSGKTSLLDDISNRGIIFGSAVVLASIGTAVGLVLPGLFISLVYVCDEAHTLITNKKLLNPNLYMMHMPHIDGNFPKVSVVFEPEDQTN